MQQRLTLYSDTIFQRPVPTASASQVIVVISDGHVLCFLQLLLVLSNQVLVNLNLWCLGELTHKLKVWLIGEPASEPQERLLEVVVAPGAQIVVLQVSFPVKLDILGLDLPVLHINLVAYKNDGYVLANSYNVAMPVRDVLIRDTRGHVEHDDGTLALNVVPVTQPAKFLLARCVPHIEGKGTTIGCEFQWMDLDA